MLEDGLTQLPRNRWLSTSRIVGYEEVSFDLPPAHGSEAATARHGLFAGDEPEGEPTLTPERLHLLPFTLQQIRRFADNWYALREAD